MERLHQVKKILGIDKEAEVATVNVTPKMAAQLTTKRYNKNNRRLNKAHVETLKRDMEAGNWYLDSDYIAFDKEGILINGHHRLKALSIANVESVTMKFDFNSVAHISMDTGLVRKYSDQVKISAKAGVEIMSDSYKKIVVCAINLNSQSKYEPTNSEIEVMSNRYMSALKLCDKHGLFDLGPRASVVVKASLFLAYLSGVDINLLDNFANVLKNGITKSDTDIPIIRLRDELMFIRGTSNDKNMRRATLTQHYIWMATQGSTSNRLPSNPTLHYTYNVLKVLEDP